MSVELKDNWRLTRLDLVALQLQSFQLFTAFHIYSSFAKRFSRIPLDVQRNTFVKPYIITACMNVVIKSAGEISQASMETKQALMKNLSTKSSWKQITARRDLRIYINSIFFMEKSTLLYLSIQWSIIQ